jgi:hypothetical protein
MSRVLWIFNVFDRFKNLKINVHLLRKNLGYSVDVGVFYNGPKEREREFRSIPLVDHFTRQDNPSGHHTGCRDSFNWAGEIAQKTEYKTLVLQHAKTFTTSYEKLGHLAESFSESDKRLLTLDTGAFPCLCQRNFRHDGFWLDFIGFKSELLQKITPITEIIEQTTWLECILKQKSDRASLTVNEIEKIPAKIPQNFFDNNKHFELSGDPQFRLLSWYETKRKLEALSDDDLKSLSKIF